MHRFFSKQEKPAKGKEILFQKIFCGICKTRLITELNLCCLFFDFTYWKELRPQYLSTQEHQDKLQNKNIAWVIFMHTSD